MAEGLCRALRGDALEPVSAGIEKHGLNPDAVAVMAEIGIDISGHQSKTLDDLPGEFDYVVTVCGHANETCPYFPAKTAVVHRGLTTRRRWPVRPPRMKRGFHTTAVCVTRFASTYLPCRRRWIRSGKATWAKIGRSGI